MQKSLKKELSIVTVITLITVLVLVIGQQLGIHPLSGNLRGFMGSMPSMPSTSTSISTSASVSSCNGICEAIDYTSTGCPADCMPVCGNTFCDAGETPITCPADCTATGYCGNAICDTGETTTCPADCIPPPPPPPLCSCTFPAFYTTNSVCSTGAGTTFAQPAGCAGTNYGCCSFPTGSNCHNYSASSVYSSLGGSSFVDSNTCKERNASSSPPESGPAWQTRMGNEARDKAQGICDAITTAPSITCPTPCVPDLDPASLSHILNTTFTGFSDAACPVLKKKGRWRGTCTVVSYCKNP